MTTKAEDVIEEFGLNYRIALDAISNFYDAEFICQELCKMIDDHGRSEEFAEFIEDSFGGKSWQTDERPEDKQIESA